MVTSEFTPASQLRHLRQFFRTAGLSVRASLPLARRLFLRDIRARYRLSVLGFAWIVLPAIAQTLVWLFLNASKIINSGTTRLPLPLYVLIGTLLWQGFTDALNSPGNQLSNAASMLSRVSFPAESLLFAGLADLVVNMAVRLVVAVPLLVYYRVVPGWGLLIAPIAIGVVLTLGFAIGLVLAPFGVLYPDLSRLLVLVSGFWMLVTPVAYAVPSSGPGRLLSVINPVTAPLVTAREWITGGGLAIGGQFVVVTIASAVLLFVGWVIYRLSIPHLIDRIGN